MMYVTMVCAPALLLGPVSVCLAMVDHRLRRRP